MVARPCAEVHQYAVVHQCVAVRPVGVHLAVVLHLVEITALMVMVEVMVVDPIILVAMEVCPITVVDMTVPLGTAVMMVAMVVVQEAIHHKMTITVMRVDMEDLQDLAGTAHLQLPQVMEEPPAPTYGAEYGAGAPPHSSYGGPPPPGGPYAQYVAFFNQSCVANSFLRFLLYL